MSLVLMMIRFLCEGQRRTVKRVSHRNKSRNQGQTRRPWRARRPAPPPRDPTRWKRLRARTEL